MFNKLIIGVILSTILLGACNNEAINEKENEKTSAEQEQINLLVQKQRDLEKSIAKETILDEDSVKVMLASISDTEMGCSVVLSTENELDKTTIQQIEENIMTAVSENGSIEINGEDIVITNVKGEVLN